MSIKKQHLQINSAVLKDKVNRYAILGLFISIVTIAIASVLVSYFMTGHVSFYGVILAHKTNPALWGLDLTPFMFAYWGQSFCYEIANTMEDMLEHTTRAFNAKSSDLEFKLEYANNHDYLTHLPNQKLLLQRLQYNLQHLNKGENLVVMVLSLNQFQDTQELSGSFHANSLLVQFSEILKSILLEPYLLQAYMGMNMVARLDGAEFVFLLPRVRKSHDLEAIIKNILEAATANLMIDGQKVRVTTTIGIAIAPIHSNDPETLMRAASTALAFARKNKQSYAVYKADMNVKDKTQHIRVEELLHAIASDSLEILYEPEILLKDGKILGTELVARFIDSEGNITRIDNFIPLVQGTHYIKKLTDLMLRNAAINLRLWHDNGHKIYARVNLYELADTSLPQKIKALLEEFKLKPEFLKIAFTERACLVEQHKSSEILADLVKMKINISISDFCSGYAAFTYLSHIEIDELKLDPAFMHNIIEEPKKRLLAKTVLAIANNLDLKLYAQGITNKDILKILEDLGYIYGQGSYFASGLTSEEIARRLSL